MRLAPTFAAAAGLWLAGSALSSALAVDSGLEVKVNPASSRGGETLLYPGGEFSRYVPPLLYPGERRGPISLHMPTKRRAVARKEPAQAATEAPAERPAPPPRRVASAAPPPPRPKPQPQAQAPVGNPFGPDLSNVFGAKPAPAPKPAAPPPPQQQTSQAGLLKRSVILFAKDAADPAEGALGAIKFLASDLNAAMTTPSARIELQAFGGSKGDKGSDARRLSLKRALAIRQVLIDDGVSPDRIDVRAMGGADDSGPADRVDVYTKA